MNDWMEVASGLADVSVGLHTVHLSVQEISRSLKVTPPQNIKAVVSALVCINHNLNSALHVLQVNMRAVEELYKMGAWNVEQEND